MISLDQQGWEWIGQIYYHAHAARTLTGVTIVLAGSISRRNSHTPDTSAYSKKSFKLTES